MLVKTITRNDAREIFEKYATFGEIPEEAFNRLNADYLSLRRDLLRIEADSRTEDIYQSDLFFALKLYEYLNSKQFFNETVAGSNDFWRYLCVCVVPDLIARRHGFVASYFYEKPGRIYLQAMWWYIHMSYQSTIESTFEALKNLNTDYILQLVERQGRDGFYLEVSREIIKIISKLPATVVNHKVCGKNLYRRVLIQNTAKQDNYNLMADGKAEEYVETLFRACKVEVKDYD